MPINYQLGKIYKITSGELTYIGSTCEPTLARRLAGHVNDFKQWKKGNRKKITSLQLIETGTYEITLIELCPCGSKDELHAQERFYIENTVCVNKNIPNRTKKDYDATLYEVNKEAILERKKIYYESNTEIIKEQTKTYREANRDKINEKLKSYREANRDKINEKQKAKYHAKKELTQIV